MSDFKSFEIINVGDHQDLNYAVFLNDSMGFAGGGKKYHHGYIYSTINGGANWKRVKTLNFSSVYSFGFLNDSVGFVGCDRLSVKKTVNAGNTWFFDGFGRDIPIHFYDRVPIREYKFQSDSVWFAIGGDIYNKGLFYKTINGGKKWSFQFFDHELRGMSFTDNGTIYIAGFGYVAKSKNGGESFRKLDLSGDFFTGIECLNNDEIVCVGNNGGVYKSKNAGESWEKIRRKNSYFKFRRSYNGLKFHNKSLGIAIGNYGLMSVTKNGGETWEDFQLEGNPHLFSVKVKGDEFIIASEDGNIIKLNVNSIF